MLKSIASMFLIALGSAAHACTCSSTPLSTEVARSAKSVVIFRLVQAQLPDESDRGSHSHEVQGKVTMMEQLRGHGPAVQEVNYSTSACCGVRLDVGSYYVAFVSGSGTRFRAHTENVVDLGPAKPSPETRAGIVDLINGRKTLDQVFPRAMRDRVEQSPIPIPCPRMR
jgi:hypothetical protein